MSHSRRFLLVFACALLFETAARADNPPINADLFRPSVHRGDILGVEGAGRDRGGIWYTGAYLTLSNDVFTVLDENNHRLFSAIMWHTKADVFASVRLWKFLSIGLDVPVILYETGDTPAASTSLKHLSNTALGDARVGIKATIVGRKGEGFGLALAEDLTVPSAYPRDVFAGDSLPTGTSLLVLDYLKRGWQIALNAGYRARQTERILGDEVRNQIILSGALSVPFICGKLHGFGTLEGRTSGIEPFKHSFENGLDGMLGGRLNLGSLAILAAGGGSFLSGYGSAAYRGTISLAYEPEPYRGCAPDRDGDGVEDAKDRCPDTPGDPKLGGCPDKDHDGIPDIDDLCPNEPGPRATGGCPDRDHDGIADKDDLCPTIPGKKEFAGCPDTDGDGIPDKDDRCPTQPGPKATQGCPDKDHDGIADIDDRCPTQPGPKATQGCPDRDGDGIADKDDKCPDQPGPKATQGCPDRDGDGIADKDDKCPDQPGLKALQGCPDADNDGIADNEDKCPDIPGNAANHGCPETKIVVTETQIYITEMVFFQTGKDRILSRSFGILKAVAKTINKEPTIKLVRVEGHTDNVGAAHMNMDLSRRRALSVMKFLIKNGVKKERLTSEGYGMTHPIADNNTDQGRERNRRVTFMVLERVKP